MNKVEDTNTIVQKPVVAPINAWREGVLFTLIGSSTVTVGLIFSIISLLLPILVIPWFITSIPTGLTGATNSLEYIQVFFGDISGALIAAFILGLIAHFLYMFNKLLFQTIRVFDHKFRWMDPFNIITRLNNYKMILKMLFIVAIVFGTLFTIITMSGNAISWEDWGNRGN